MGNKLFNQYSIEKKPFLSGGYMNMWKIHKATHRDRKQDACIFVCDKKQFETMAAPNREGILSILRKEASALQKYKHPSILGVYEPLAEDKTTMGFVTEPFEYSVSSWYDTLKPSKLEIKLMVTELCKVLCFLHEDAHVIHTNISPDVIFIDKDNKIKVSGMSFALNDPPIAGAEVLYNNTMCPYLNYTAPETIFENKAYYTSDTFTIGLIIFSLLEMHRGNVQYKNLINLSSNKIENYKSVYGDIDQKLGRSNFESEDMTVLYSTLNRSPNARPRVKDLLETQWFNDPKLKALAFVENFAANDMNKNVEFLNQFPKIVNMFENKLVTQRFLPCLLGALKNEMLINAAIPAIFAVSENPELKISFGTSVWPRLKEVLQMKSIPAASLYFLLKKVQYISDNISNTEFSNHFLNLACKAMDCNVAKIQIVVVKNLEVITKKIDSLSFKNMIYPRMVKMCLDSNSSSFKVEVLNKLKVLYSKLDQGIINDSLLTNLEKIRKSDNSTEVCIAIANIYEEISKIASLEAVGQKILPNVVAILIQGRISKSSFEALMNLVQNFLEKIKKAREKDLIDDLARASGMDLGGGDIGGMDISKTNAGAKAADKDDFLNTLLNQDKGGSTAFGAPSSTPIQPLNIGSSSSSMPSFSMNTMKSSPSNNQSGGGLDFLGDLGVPSSSSNNMMSSSNKPSNNLFEGLNTNTSSQSKPMTHTGGMFSNRNNTTSNNPFDNLNNFGSSSSFGNSNRGATLDSLMSDLPSSNPTQNNNAFGGFDQNKSSNLNLGDFGKSSSNQSGNMGMFDLGGFNQSSNNNSSMGGFNQSSNNNAMGGFNQNSLDFLSPSTNKPNNTNTGFNFMSNTNTAQTNSFNAFDFGSNTNQRNNNMNVGNQFDFMAQSNNNKRNNNFNAGSGSNNPFDFI